MSYIDTNRVKDIRAAVKLVIPKGWRYRVTQEHGAAAVLTIYSTPHALGDFLTPKAIRWSMPNEKIHANVTPAELQRLREIINEGNHLVSIDFMTDVSAITQPYKEKFMDILTAMNTRRDNLGAHDVFIRFGDYDNRYTQEERKA